MYIVTSTAEFDFYRNAIMAVVHFDGYIWSWRFLLLLKVETYKLRVKMLLACYRIRLFILKDVGPMVSWASGFAIAMYDDDVVLIAAYDVLTTVFASPG